VSALFAVQSASYVLLFGWYWMVSGTSLYTEMHVVAPKDLSLPAFISVYYISSSDDHVYRRSLDGSGEQRLLGLDARDRNDRLFICPSAQDGGGWDLMARLKSQDPNKPRLEVVRTNLQGEAAPDKTTGKENEYRGTWFSFGEVAAIGSAKNSPWKFFAGFWSIEGVRATRKDTGEQVRFSYDTPFAAWTVRNAVHLPSDKLLFQFGHDQICVFDPAQRKVALLWHGRGPVAVIEKVSGISNAGTNGATASPTGDSGQ
jgi:hypothetical protein